MFQEITVSPSSGCAGGLEEPKLIARCPTLGCIYLHLARRRMECDPSGWWEESTGCCTWPDLSIAGYGKRFSKLITGCYVQFNMKPAENFNREAGFILSYTWQPVISLLKCSPQPAVERSRQVQQPLDSSH
jgi:hypothetical protein